jgi:hypothetical protein
MIYIYIYHIYNIFLQYWSLNSGIHTWIPFESASHPVSFVIFQVGAHVFFLAGHGPQISYLYLSCSWDYRLYHHTQFGLWYSASLTFFFLWLNSNHNAAISTSKAAEIIGASHHARLSERNWSWLTVLA